MRMNRLDHETMSTEAIAAVAAVTQAANALADTLNQLAAVYASMCPPLWAAPLKLDGTPAMAASRVLEAGSTWQLRAGDALRLLESAAERKPTTWEPPA
ncbi:exported hypothetical protein [Bradyrhizobium sp. STM 3809]|nr:exported hypothetical protein [Bradyrhizobium sp. STM 3809]